MAEGKWVLTEYDNERNGLLAIWHLEIPNQPSLASITLMRDGGVSLAGISVDEALRMLTEARKYFGEWRRQSGS